MKMVCVALVLLQSVGWAAELPVRVVSRAAERAELLAGPGGLAAGEAALAVFDRAKYQYVGERAGVEIHAVFLNRAGRVLESDNVAPGSHGVTSKVEAPLVLLEPAGAPLPKPGSRLKLPSELKHVKPEPEPRIRIGKATLHVEIADTPALDQLGLMYRKRMSANEGMLFIYDQPHVLSHWMAHCYFPLSIAFADARGKIVNIEEMQPYADPENPGPTPRTWESKGAAKYAVEANAGWFARHEIKVGAVIKIAR